MSSFTFSHDEALSLDEADPLSSLRDEFVIPVGPDGVEQAYFAGNSLGLMLKSTPSALENALSDWGSKGVRGHFEGPESWYQYDEVVSALQAELVGAAEQEVGIMGSLTINLHLLMASFFKPLNERKKILIEPHAFPSDRYAAAAQVAWHGGNPETDVIEIKATNPDQVTLTDLSSTLDDHGETINLALIGGLNYYTGQYHDIAGWMQELKKYGITVGLDLAHAVGNVPLELHDLDIDFAAWCTYKYLNGGPGSISGYFVHEKHHRDHDLVRLSGWWGNDPETRFDMHGQERFIPRQSADGWKVSNPSLFSMVPLKASLEIFQQVGLEALRERSIRQTAYLEAGIRSIDGIESITPIDPNQRGCQLSVRVKNDASAMEQKLISAGVVPDARDPDVLRFAPTPMYTSFQDISRALHELAKLIQ
tara:strand:- start:704 stop:1969 length:1266 start_codon:yes stop_codon:yes gene_type:complete